MNKWTLLVVLLIVLGVADWLSGGLGPRLVFGTATIDLKTSPEGAAVTLNGDRAGVTPLTLWDVRPGAVVLLFEHPYHRAELRRLTLGRDERRTVELTFEAAVGRLTVVTNPRGAAVTLDGEALVDRTPVTLDETPTGRHEVLVSMQGRETKSATVEVFPEQTTEHTFELERLRMGSLSLQTTPASASIELLEVPVAYRPGVELPVGEYRIRVSAPGHGAVERTVAVKQGRNIVDLALSRVFGRLRLKVSPRGADVRVTWRDEGGSRTVAYEEDMRLPAGAFAVRATAVGYRNLLRSLTMSAGGVRLALAMQRFDVKPGQRFRDALRSGGEGPELIVVDAGSFRMGSDGGPANERPAREVRVTQPFAIGVHEVTVGAFRSYDDWPGEPDMPISNVTLQDVDGYLAFLSRETGYRYRLPTESEWEYAARAGSDTTFFFGDDIGPICRYANVGDASMQERFRQYASVECDDGFVRVAPVGSFAPNAFGLHDVFGNVEEWVADCWHLSYETAPPDAREWTRGCYSSRVVRGGAFDSPPDDLRASARNLGTAPTDSRGFRVVREL